MVENKRKKECQELDSIIGPVCASPPSLAGRSQEEVNIDLAAAVSLPTDLSQLTALQSSVIKKLDKRAQASASQESFSDFTGAHLLSSPEDEGGEITVYI